MVLMSEGLMGACGEGDGVQLVLKLACDSVRSHSPGLILQTKMDSSCLKHCKHARHHYGHAALATEATAKIGQSFDAA
jgi:hypothetical protein